MNVCYSYVYPYVIPIKRDYGARFTISRITWRERDKERGDSNKPRHSIRIETWRFVGKEMA